MIIDHISNRGQYEWLGADFKAALDYFAGVHTDHLEKGDISLENADVLIKVRPMDTKPAQQCQFEAHREYADIHFLAYGAEKSVTPTLPVCRSCPMTHRRMRRFWREKAMNCC